ncbi:MAG: TIGR04438 family Trp-rich protein [Burkholderiaceae bacterium]
MFFLILGVALVLMKYLEVTPVVTGLSWWLVLLPFGLAMAWWWFADSTGLTKRQQMEKEQKKKQNRVDKQREAMGLLPKKKR